MTSSSGVIPPRGRGRQLNLSLGTTDEDRRACQVGEAPSRGVLVYRGVKQRNSMGIKKKTTNRTRGASRVAGGGTLRLGQGTGPTRTTQRRRVGGLRPKLHSIGVAGEFGDVVESAKNGRRGRRAGPTAPLGAHHAMASTRRARRRRGRFARRPRRKGGKCSNSRRGKLLGGPSVQRRARRVGSFALGAGNRPI